MAILLTIGSSVVGKKQKKEKKKKKTQKIKAGEVK